MIRRLEFLLCLAFVGCSTAPTRFEDALPGSAGEWRREAVQPLSSVPPAIDKMGVASAAAATYMGPASVTVHVFRMRAETSAFELIQTWRQTDGLAVYKGPYFIVAQPGGADESRVRSLLQSLQKEIK